MARKASNKPNRPVSVQSREGNISRSQYNLAKIYGENRARPRPGGASQPIDITKGNPFGIVGRAANATTSRSTGPTRRRKRTDGTRSKSRSQPMGRA